MGDEPTRPPAAPAPHGRAVVGNTGRAPWWRREIRYFIEIAAIAGFAVAQPMLASFGESPETFVTTGASRVAIVLFGLLLVVGPPLIVWMVAAVSGFAGVGVRRVAQGMAVGLLAAVFAQWALQGLLPGPVVPVGALALGGATAVGYLRFSALRLYLSYALVAPVAFLVLFVGFSPVTPLVFAPKPIEPRADAGAARPSVVVLVLDELPTASLLDADNEIDAELFPNLARLADDSSFYRNHTTVAAHTDAALPAIITGRYPADVKAGRRDYSENLFSLLASTHDLNVHEAITGLCTASQCERPIDARAMKPLSERAWGLWSDLLSAGDGKMSTESAVLRALQRGRFEKPDEFIDSLEALGDRPRLDFGHLLLPHQVWETVPDGRHYSSEIPYPGVRESAFTTDTAAQLARQRHLLQLQFTDRVVGEMLDRLQELDRYDDSYVVVMADHGVAFQPDEFYRGAVLTDRTVPEVIWSPLFVKEPHQAKGSVSDENAQTIDLLPTIADGLGIDVPWKVDGRSLLGSKTLPGADKRYLPRTAANGEYVRVDGVKGFERMLALPPPSAVPSSDPLALYRLAPYPELTGTRVDDLPKGPPVDLDVRLDDPERYEDVDLRAKFLPVYVSGEIDAPRDGDARYVVSVNGVIGGWSANETAWTDPDRRTQSRYAVVVPPSLLRSGRNVIDVYVLSGEPGSVVLQDVNFR